MAKHFEVELHECGLKTQVLKGRQLEAALPADRKPEDHATRPAVAPGELAVFIAPICPFAHRAWLTALEKCGPKGFRAIHVPLGRDCKPKWYSEVYDKATVPALQMGPDFTLGDSIPVCKWIDEHMDGPLLSPQDSATKEAVERVIALFGSKIVGPCYSLLKNKIRLLITKKARKFLPDASGSMMFLHSGALGSKEVRFSVEKSLASSSVSHAPSSSASATLSNTGAAVIFLTANMDDVTTSTIGLMPSRNDHRSSCPAGQENTTSTATPPTLITSSECGTPLLQRKSKVELTKCLNREHKFELQGTQKKSVPGYRYPGKV